MTTWNPAEYARNSAAQAHWAGELLARLDLKGHEAVLDLGCGDGKVTAVVGQAVPRGRVVGVDSSKEMIQFARMNHFECSNLKFRLLDVLALDYTEEFDLVFSNAALHWVQDHRSLLARVWRALRGGGRLAFSFGGKGNAGEVLRIAGIVGRTRKWREYFQGFQNPYAFYGAEEYRPWLAEAGFRPTRVELLPKDMVHAGEQGMLAWIRTTWMPITGQVPEEKREDFIKDFAAAYLEAFPADGEGNVHVGMMRLEVEATKP